MPHRLLLGLSLALCAATANSQLTTLTRYSAVIKPDYNWGLVNPLYTDANCVMKYDPTLIDANGAAFTYSFVNPGGTGYKGYPSGVVGGMKAGGVYYPGNVTQCGMPVQIPNLDYDLRIRWKVSQVDGNDADDKWWATINVIFDGGTATSEPLSDDRDYDLVIALKQYQQEDLTDKAKVDGAGAYWYFARNTDGSLKTLDLNYNGTVYQFAVRYKFFSYNVGDINYAKNNKVHTKFIPVDNGNCAPYLDHSLKLFVETTKNFLQYLNLSTDELTLANDKVANADLFVKSIAAGYEVYTGSFTINNDYFYTVLDHTASAAPSNLMITHSATQAVLDWDDCTDSDFDTYKVYRSVNGGAYELLADNVLTSTYTDNGLATDMEYQYYVVTKDRSFNVSAPSITVSKPDVVPPLAPVGLTVTQSSEKVLLDWDNVFDSWLASYSVYRAVNRGAFVLLADNLTESSYTDESVEAGKVYQYYVISKDHSMNLSAPSDSTSIIVATNSELTIYPNPVKKYFSFLTIRKVVEVSVFYADGKLVSVLNKIGDKYDIGALKCGLYMLNIQTEDGSVIYKKMIVNE